MMLIVLAVIVPIMMITLYIFEFSFRFSHHDPANSVRCHMFTLMTCGGAALRTSGVTGASWRQLEDLLGWRANVACTDVHWVDVRQWQQGASRVKL
jgi:hypothetical protein